MIFQPWRGNQPGGQTTNPGQQTTDKVSVDSNVLINTAGSAVECVAFSPDGSFLVPNGDLTMWDPTTGTKVKQLTGGGWGVAVSPDSKMLAVGDAFNTVTLWATDTGQSTRTMPLTSDEGTVVETVAFSPDGTLFAASGTGPVRSWNTATGAEAGTLDTEVTKAALSPDGTLLATAGTSDYDVRLWDSETGELVKTFTGHANAVNAIAFSADGRLLATGGDDQTARVWLID